ncbi:aminotransferase class IV [Rhodocytophaga aerolata]|uniref:branched-chain-amino-acid transaminase n=1 Tax=Rhodocytophaga aerolata TaxID=455078 RepID=A0ABT8R9A2_9BACT|nr:aminotransferase class IV [Rhodocytophaga aerolata]MDO1447342.1 aminotransferase class IV [Rhodocytophaga aerolata]
MNIIYNFEWAKEFSLMPEPGNRAFQYGDGLFETIIYKQGQTRFLEDHYTRLMQGANAFGMQVPIQFSLPYLQESIQAIVRANNLGNSARIRIHMWRKAGGTYTPLHHEAEFCITAHTLSATASAVKENVYFYEDIRLVASPLSRFKTCNALPYVMAGIAMKQKGAHDMILLDVYGHISECVASNLFWIKENVLYTPGLASGCIEGIMRKQIFRKAPELQVPIQEGLFFKEDLLSAEAVFCCNVAGIQVIRQVAGEVFQEKHPVFEELLAIG